MQFYEKGNFTKILQNRIHIHRIANELYLMLFLSFALKQRFAKKCMWDLNVYFPVSGLVSWIFEHKSSDIEQSVDARYIPLCQWAVVGSYTECTGQAATYWGMYLQSKRWRYWIYKNQIIHCCCKSILFHSVLFLAINDILVFDFISKLCPLVW